MRDTNLRSGLPEPRLAGMAVGLCVVATLCELRLSIRTMKCVLKVEGGEKKVEKRAKRAKRWGEKVNELLPD